VNLSSYVSHVANLNIISDVHVFDKVKIRADLEVVCQ